MIVLVSKNKVSGNDAIFQNFLPMVNIVQKGIEGRYALLNAIVQPLPLRRRDDARDHVERQDPVYGFILGIDSKRDAEVEEFLVGFLGARNQFANVESIKALSDFSCVGETAAAEHFAVETAHIIICKRARRLL